jgi:hypothetical protein
MTQQPPWPPQQGPDSRLWRSEDYDPQANYDPWANYERATGQQQSWPAPTRPGWQQPPQYPTGPWRPAPHRRGRTRVVVLSLVGGFVVIFLIVIAASHGSPSSPAGTTAVPAGGTSAPAAPVATAAAAAPRVVATFSGSGQENTSRFTVSASWKLSYSFSCASFGSSGNFIVFEDGGKDLNGVTVNELGASKSGSSWAYGDAGTHYLQIDSECSWSVTVTDEG